MSIETALVIVLHVVCLAVQAAAFSVAVRRRRLYAVFFGAVAYYQLVSLFTIVALSRDYGAMLLFRAEVIALLGTGFVSACVFAGDRLVPAARAGADPRGPVDSVGARPGTYFAIVGACLLVITAVMLRGGLQFVERTWQQARLESNYLDSLATLMLFIVFPAAWIAARSRHFWWSAVLLTYSLVLFVVFGSRAALLTLPMVLILDAYLRFGTSRIRVRTLALVMLAAITLHVFGRMVRGFGLAGLVALVRGETMSSAELLEVLANVDLSGGEAAIFRYFLYVLSASPLLDIEPLTSVVRWLAIYVPGGLFPGAKPEDVTYTIWWHAFGSGVFDAYESFGELLKVVGAGGGGSLHPLVWGEMWVNGGVLAIPVYAAGLGAILLLIESAYARVANVVYVLAAPATLIGYVMVARGNSTIGFGYTAYVLPIALAAYGALQFGRWLLVGSEGRRVGAHAWSDAASETVPVPPDGRP